jgi:hypothetical protein
LNYIFFTTDTSTILGRCFLRSIVEPSPRCRVDTASKLDHTKQDRRSCAITYHERSLATGLDFEQAVPSRKEGGQQNFGCGRREQETPQTHGVPSSATVYGTLRGGSNPTMPATGQSTTQFCSATDFFYKSALVISTRILSPQSSILEQAQKCHFRIASCTATMMLLSYKHTTNRAHYKRTIRCRVHTSNCWS